MSAIQLGTIVGFLAAGAILAAVHLWLLHRTVTAIGSGDRLIVRTLVPTLIRMVLAVGVFWAAAQFGAAAILATLVGFVLSRELCLRRVRTVDK